MMLRRNAILLLFLALLLPLAGGCGAGGDQSDRSPAAQAEADSLAKAAAAQADSLAQVAVWADTLAQEAKTRANSLEKADAPADSLIQANEKAEALARVAARADSLAKGARARADSLAKVVGQANSLWSWLKGKWAWGLVALLLLGAIGVGGYGVWGKRKRKDETIREGQAPPSPRVHPDDRSGFIPNERGRLHEKAAQRAREGRYDDLVSEVQDLKGMIKELTGEVRALGGKKHPWESLSEAASERGRRGATYLSSEEPSAPAPSRDPGEAVAQTFVEWCRRGGPMISRDGNFIRELQKHIPEARMRIVRRDLDSPARPIEFDERGGNSPAEYWLVEVGEGRWLLPQPVSGGQFRDTGEVFEGRAAPSQLQDIRPAEVRQEGSVLRLIRPGLLS